MGHFQESIREINANVHHANECLLHGKIDTSNSILRSQIIFLESAFDFYMHEITRWTLVEIHEGRRRKTKGYNTMAISMKDVEDIIDSENSPAVFGDVVARKFSFRTMLENDQFRGQLSLLGLNYKDIADHCFYQKGDKRKSEDKMKELISDLYKLRNDIAHHASRNQYDAVPLSITSDALCDYRDGVISIAEAIDMVVRMKSL